MEDKRFRPFANHGRSQLNPDIMKRAMNQTDQQIKAQGTPALPSQDCRPGCAACCIAPSINTPMPGMPNGKPAGVPCVQLTADLRCALFGLPERPAFCSGLQASTEMCGETREYALLWIARLETATAPDARAGAADS